MQDSKKKIIISCVLFWAILLGLLSLSSGVIRRVVVQDAKASQLKRNAVEVQLKKEKPNSIDVFVFGDSEAYSTISPMQIWDELGVPTFVASQAGQTMSETYHLFEVAMAKQKPKVVMLEAHNMLYSSGSAVAIQNVMMDKWENIFPIFKYHDLWKGKGNASAAVTPEFKGFKIRTGVKSCSPSGSYLDENAKAVKIPYDNQLFLENIVRYCNNNGIKVILFSAPSPVNYNGATHKGLQKLATQLNVPYMDMNRALQDIQIDWSSDSVDGGDHLNMAGAQKATNYMITQLKKMGLKNHKSEAIYDSWNKLGDQYKEARNQALASIRTTAMKSRQK